MASHRPRRPRRPGRPRNPGPERNPRSEPQPKQKPGLPPYRKRVWQRKPTMRPGRAAAGVRNPGRSAAASPQRAASCRRCPVSPAARPWVLPNAATRCADVIYRTPGKPDAGRSSLPCRSLRFFASSRDELRNGYAQGIRDDLQVVKVKCGLAGHTPRQVGLLPSQVAGQLGGRLLLPGQDHPDLLRRPRSQGAGRSLRLLLAHEDILNGQRNEDNADRVRHSYRDRLSR
ncbi:hypothetical protein L083_0332 [Actinoplanes sp. N902-109]|nr:hypothetical protein L083_0332 [Actinoplanes sp. N902-109]